MKAECPGECSSNFKDYFFPPAAWVLPVCWLGWGTADSTRLPPALATHFLAGSVFAAVCRGLCLPCYTAWCSLRAGGTWELSPVPARHPSAPEPQQCVLNSCWHCQEHVRVLSTFPARQALAVPVPELQMLVTRQPSN